MTSHRFPFRRAENMIGRVWRVLIFARRFRHLAKGASISPFTELVGMEAISLGKGSHISRRCRLLVTPSARPDDPGSAITIGDNVYVGIGCTLSATGTIRIENDVTFGDNVYVSAGQHEYHDPDLGVLQQPIADGSVTIGQGAWIGYGAFISTTSTIEIGAHAIVAANSVLTTSVPSYTMVGGVPARPLRRRDPESGEWQRVSVSMMPTNIGRSAGDP